MFGADGGAEDLHDEYLKATLKKAGLPDHLEVAEMRLEYGVRDSNGTEWWHLTSRQDAEELANEEGENGALIVRDVIYTKAREATPRG